MLIISMFSTDPAVKIFPPIEIFISLFSMVVVLIDVRIFYTYSKSLH